MHGRRIYVDRQRIRSNFLDFDKLTLLIEQLQVVIQDPQILILVSDRLCHYPMIMILTRKQTPLIQRQHLFVKVAQHGHIRIRGISGLQYYPIQFIKPIDISCYYICRIQGEHFMFDPDQAAQADVIKRFSQSAGHISYGGKRVLRFSIFPYHRSQLV